MRRHPVSVKTSLKLIPALAAVLLIPFVLTACGGDDASVEQRLEEKGTMDVIEEASAAEYEPPADGELTENQVEMYIEVQERALEIRKVAQRRMEERTGGEEGAEEKKPGLFDALRAVGDLGDVVTAELRAAQELGHNPAEYQWVQEQILEAHMVSAGRQMQEGFNEMSQQVLASLEEQRENVDDPELRARIDEQIEEYKANLESQEEDEGLEPGVAHNIELLEEYDERIQTLRERASELSG